LEGAQAAFQEAINLVFAADEEFGLYLWLSLITGAHCGEVTGLREHRFDFPRQQLRLARNYLVKDGQHMEKAPKDGRAAGCHSTR